MAHGVARALGLLTLAAMTLVGAPTQASGATRRAVLVGIGRYAPASPGHSLADRRDWPALDGPANDVKAVRSVLVERFAFEPANIVVLQDEQATRSAIVAAIRSHLIAGSEAGDVAFFFFAGHGSQQFNSLSSEHDQKDETLVPYDALSGGPPIRDKELSRLFNQVLDTGAALTLVYDSCHSGSLTRGAAKTDGKRRARFVRLQADDARDAGATGPPPEERGALVLSAAQDFQVAEEIGEAAEARGIFTAALVGAWRAAPVWESITQTFVRVAGTLRAQGIAQLPVMAGNGQRRSSPVFPLSKGQTAPPPAVTVMAAVTQGLQVNGGRCMGLFRGGVLSWIGPAGKVQRWVVAASVGADQSVVVPQGQTTATPAVGTQLVVESWGTPEIRPLRIALSPYPVDQGMPSVQSEPRRPQTHRALSLSKRLRDALTGSKQAVQVVSSADEADVALAVRVQAPDSLGEYAWMTRDPDTGTWVQPPETAWVRTAGTHAVDGARHDEETTAQQLLRQLSGLMRLHVWLNLPAGQVEDFPYRLGVETADGQPLASGAQVQTGQALKVWLRQEGEEARGFVRRQWVYLLAVSERGESALLFPRSDQGNVENLLPAPEQFSNQGLAPRQMELNKVSIRTAEPIGSDWLVLITSAEPLMDPSVLTSEAAVANTRGTSQPRLAIEEVTRTLRGENPALAQRVASWSLQSFRIRTVKAN